MITIEQFVERLSVTLSIVAYIGALAAAITLADKPSARREDVVDAEAKKWRPPSVAEWAWFLFSVAWVLADIYLSSLKMLVLLLRAIK